MMTRNEAFCALAIDRLNAKRSATMRRVEHELKRAGAELSEGSIREALANLVKQRIAITVKERRNGSGGKSPLLYALTDDGRSSVRQFLQAVRFLSYAEYDSQGWINPPLEETAWTR